MRICAAALALLLASATTAVADPAPILGGTQATVGQFPTVVAIRLGGGLCTGTLITPEWVLTAGHCVTPSIVGEPDQATLTADTTVFFDTVDALNVPGRQIKAVATMPHPGYSGGLDDDVGLIHLATPITDRTPVPLNRSAAAAAVGIHLQMVGFGVNQSGTMNAGVEYVLADKQTDSCTTVGAQPQPSDVNLLCWAQQNLQGKCEGDSGGPSFAMVGSVKKQVGITSVGWSSSSNQTACNGWGADTRVDHVIDWLDATIGASLKCAKDGVCTPGCANPVDPDCPPCTKDSDCTGKDQVCDQGVCTPAPNTPGGVGSTCTGNADCASGSCGQVGSDKKCTQTCQPDNNTCPSGFDCIASGTNGECWPGASGGSCAAGGSASGPTLFLIGLAAIALVRGRRRPRR